MNLHISVLPCGRRKKASGSVQRGLVRVGHGPVNTTTVQREVEVLIQSHHGPCIVELATIVRGAEQGDLGTPHRNRRTLCGQPAEHATRFLLPKNSYLVLEQEPQALRSAVVTEPTILPVVPVFNHLVGSADEVKVVSLQESCNDVGPGGIASSRHLP